MKKDEYAGDLLKDLRATAKKSNSADLELTNRVIQFLTRRLTPAAIGGCHHCHEGDRGTPCWWCGLKNR